MMMTIRPIKESDFSQYQEIENESFIDPYSEKDLLYQMNENPVNKILVITDEKDKEKILGFIDYMVTFNSASICQIAVRKEYRHRGYAKMLLKAMEDTFIKEGDEKVEFITLEVRVSNTDAVRLYQRNGYEFVTIKKNYYKNGENAMYMVKAVN